jgi:hypothetical protein
MKSSFEIGFTGDWVERLRTDHDLSFGVKLNSAHGMKAHRCLTPLGAMLADELRKIPTFKEVWFSKNPHITLEAELVDINRAITTAHHQGDDLPELEPHEQMWRVIGLLDRCQNWAEAETAFEQETEEAARVIPIR